MTHLSMSGQNTCAKLGVPFFVRMSTLRNIRYTREDSMHKFTANSSGVFFRSKNYKIIFISTFLNFFLMWTSLTSSAVCLLAWTFHSLGKLNNLRFSTATGVVSHCHSHCHWVISCVNTKNLAGSAFFGSAPEPADPLSTKRHVPTVFRKLPC